MLNLIDTHAHFDDVSFAADRTEALQRAHAVGVIAQIVPAINFAQWENLRAVCQQHAGLYPAYGLHPVFLAEHEPAHLVALVDYLTREQPIAVGEFGLDYYLTELDRVKQQQFFIEQLAIAQQFKLPVILHARRAVEEVINQLRKFPSVRGVIHSFSGSVQQAKKLLDLGFYMGFGAPITYTGAHNLQRLVRYLPLENILIETDAPDQPSIYHRHQRNEPAYLPEVLSALAALRQQSIEEVAAVTTANAIRLFSLPL